MEEKSQKLTSTSSNEREYKNYGFAWDSKIYTTNKAANKGIDSGSEGGIVSEPTVTNTSDLTPPTPIRTMYSNSFSMDEMKSMVRGADTAMNEEDSPVENYEDYLEEEVNVQNKERPYMFVFEVIGMMPDSNCKKYFEVSQELRPKNSLHEVSTLGGFVDRAATWSLLNSLVRENYIDKLCYSLNNSEITKESIEHMCREFDKLVTDQSAFDLEFERICANIYDE